MVMQVYTYVVMATIELFLVYHVFIFILGKRSAGFHETNVHWTQAICDRGGKAG
jgi:hypothetical protein